MCFRSLQNLLFKKMFSEKFLSYFTFISVSLAVISCFVAAALPISLMAVWSANLHLTTAQMAVAMLSYFLGCLVSLLFLAKISNALGRKKAVLLAQAVALISCIMFIDCNSDTVINSGRFLHGIYSGLITGSAMSWAVDSAPKGKEWLGTAISVGGASFGLVTGSLIAGIGANYDLVSSNSLFEIMMFLSIIISIMIFFSKESLPVKFSLNKFIKVLKPTFKLPANKRAYFIMAAIGYVGCWGQCSFFQALSPKIAMTLFENNHNVTLLTALIYLAITLPVALCGFFTGSLNAATGIKFIMPLSFISGSAMFLSIAFHYEHAFLILLVTTGCLIGATMSLLLKLLLKDSAVSQRADIISFLYFTAYLGSAFPNLLIGKFFTNCSLESICISFILWIFIYTSIVFITNIRLAKA